MSRCTVTLLSVVLFGTVGLVCAQDPPQFPGPEQEHQWLQKFVGDWITESKGIMGPDQPPLECSGTLASHMVGGFWVINEMKGDLMGTPMTRLYAGTLAHPAPNPNIPASTPMTANITMPIGVRWVRHRTVSPVDAST